MKKIGFWMFSLAILFSACSKNDDTQVQNKTSLTITLGKSKSNLRSVGTPTQTDENRVDSFAVYIYSSGILEQTASFTTGLTQTINNVLTGVKKVVVVTNMPVGYTPPTIGSAYTDLATNIIQVETQVDPAKAFLMSGESDVTIVADPTSNNVTVPVSRVAAKVILGSITIAPTDGYDPAKFTLSGVAIIKGKSKSSIGIPDVTTQDPLYSGIAGPIVQAPNVKTFFYETITLADYANRYFYVLANDNTNNDATLLTLSGTYDGVQMYYPFIIQTTTDYIKRNTEHTINIVLHRLGAGSPDPEKPIDKTTMTVTVQPQDWIVTPVQVAEW